MKKLLIIDRDGTIIIEPEDKQIDSLEKLEFYPAVITNLCKIVNESDYELIMVSNQDGLGTDSFPENTFWPAHNKMLTTLKNEGIEFSDILIDPSFPEENSPNRKPETGLLKPYMNGDYNFKESYVIGDRESDVQLAINLGAKSILLTVDEELRKKVSNSDFATDNWNDIYRYLCCKERKTTITRNTKETQIEMSLNLDGIGSIDISSGIGFLDHMLDLFAKHSGCDIQLKSTGDLHVDEHHLVEDIAIVLGKAILSALGNKKGINRYGFLLPMDESLAQVAIDFSGRPELVWNAEFKREKIGEISTEMFQHFFKSFAYAAECNLNIKVTGENEHHKIEGIFKAVARSIKMAAQKIAGDNQVPSTKGSL